MNISENPSISVSNLSTRASAGSSDLAGNVRVNAAGEADQAADAAYRVNISQGAKDRQSAEGDPAEEGTENAGENPPGEAAQEAAGGDASMIDVAIKQIQEQIKKVKEQLAAIANDDSEAAEKQRDALQKQLLKLTTQLAALVKTKAEAA